VYITFIKTAMHDYTQAQLKQKNLNLHLRMQKAYQAEVDKILKPTSGNAIRPQPHAPLVHTVSALQAPPPVRTTPFYSNLQINETRKAYRHNNPTPLLQEVHKAQMDKIHTIALRSSLRIPPFLTNPTMPMLPRHLQNPR